MNVIWLNVVTTETTRVAIARDHGAAQRCRQTRAPGRLIGVKPARSMPLDPWWAELVGAEHLVLREQWSGRICPVVAYVSRPAPRLDELLGVKQSVLWGTHRCR